MSSEREVALRHRARQIHDARCRWCRMDGYKYVESCRLFIEAIFEAGKEQRQPVLSPAPTDGEG